MKHIFTFFLLLPAVLYSQVIATWEPSGLTGYGPSPWAANFADQGITVGGFTRGAGVTVSGTPAANGWGGTGWSTTDATAGITNNKFATFSVTVDNCYELSLSSISAFHYRRSGSGPTDALVQYNINGGAYTNITTVAFPSTSSSGAAASPVDLSIIPALQNLASGTVVEFRIVPYGATAAGGTWYIFNFNANGTDFDLSGTLTAAGPDASILTSDTAICGVNTPVQLTALNPGGTWSGPGIANPSTGLFNAQNFGPGNIYSYYTLTQNGCSSTDSVSILVTANPVAIASGFGSVCANGTPAFLSGSPQPGYWFGTGIADTALGLFDPALSGPGTIPSYYVAINLNCTDTAVVNTVVIPLPSTTLTTGSPYCPNSSIDTLTAGVTGGTWAGTGITNPSLGIFNPVGLSTGNYWVYYTHTANGCTGTDSAQITISTLPAVTATGGGVFCSNEPSVTFQGSPSGGVWFGPGINSSTGVFNPASSGTGTFFITYTVQSGNCSNSDTVFVTVNQAPNVFFTPFSPLCENDPLFQLNASPAGGVWSGPGMNQLGQFNPALTGAGTFYVRYNYTNMNGCSDIDSIDVTVISAPIIVITTNDSLCLGSLPSPLNATPGGGTWSGGPFVSGSMFDPNISGLGDFWVYYSIQNSNCPAIDSVLIHVGDTSHAFFTYSITDGTITLNADNSPGSTYLWDFGDNTTGAGQNIQYTYDATGTYTVTLTVLNECGPDVYSQQITISSLSVPEYETLDFRYGPNPVTDILRTQSNRDVAIEIFSLSGQKLMQLPEGLNHDIDFTHLTSGIYIMVVNTTDSRQTFKVVKP